MQRETAGDSGITCELQGAAASRGRAREACAANAGRYAVFQLWRGVVRGRGRAPKSRLEPPIALFKITRAPRMMDRRRHHFVSRPPRIAVAESVQNGHNVEFQTAMPELRSDGSHPRPRAGREEDR